MFRNARHFLASSAIVAVIVAVAAGAGHYAMSHASYETEADVLFTSEAFDTFQNPSTASEYTTNLIDSYADYLTSAAVLEPLGASLDPYVSSKTLEQAIKVTSSPMFLQIIYSGDNEADTKKVVDTMVTHLEKAVSQVPKVGNNKPILSISKATVITSPVQGSEHSLAKSTVVGVLIGILVGLIYLFVRAILSTKIHTPEDVAEVVDSSVLGRVSPAPTAGEITPLAHNISFMPSRDGIRTVSLCPSSQRTQAGAIAAAVADSLARTGTKTVLVDADLAQGSATQARGLDRSTAGLSDLLAGRADDAEVLVTGKADQADFIPSGTATANGGELLSGEKLTALLNELGSHYDTVIVNASAGFEASDSLTVASRTTSTVVVVGEAVTSRRELSDHLELLSMCHAHLDGVVLARKK
ncbi:AAA family ATPase [Cutibacterium equinum]|uniref:AAA family ATPase n=1 Tax=Cutibacterium equinum TaxID=3016342 RepID=A0ABY7QYF2_9ACTN|nr:tyrosine-protein kinase family protein [Cutibacterium equinum]WCC80068.1 AAA family ATPase [Cutibacterium equinum]